VRVLAAVLASLALLPACNRETEATTETATPTTTISTEAAPAPDPEVRLERVADGFEDPVQATSAPDDDRLYVVEQTGRIRVVEDGGVRDEPLLDLSDEVSCCGEQGLLSVAFHPEYASNGRLFVDYTNTDGDTRVVEFHADPTDAVADPDSAKDLLAVDQPFSNHNGGQLVFGPDGLLYVGMGDGGGAGDPDGNGQNLESQLGKLLTRDIDAEDTDWQVVAYGLRNPWRFSFDRDDDTLYVGDVGQGQWEEIDAIAWPADGLVNFGWNVLEGSHEFSGGEPNPEGTLVDPVAEYDHGNGACSVTGGFVYRGEEIDGLQGRYFYGDYCSGEVWSFRLRDGRAVAQRKEPFTVAGLTSFGEDQTGELYLVSGGGTVSRLAGN
jgi:glucose/arabinose dehydrogenase